MATTTRIVVHLPKRALWLAAVVVAAVAGAQPDPARALADVPGFDFARLPAPAKKELATVLTDEFDYCGRPLTLLGSLKKGNACGHTRRLVGAAAAMAAEGAPAAEIIVALSKYNQGFNKPRASLKPDERQCQGPKDARVTVVEFSDFECPFCAAARPMLEAFVKARGTVRLCMMPYPLPMHANAALASQAVLFARDAGKFWAMHDALFEHQLSLSDAFIKQLVGKQGLDVKAFEKAVAAGTYAAEVAASRDAGKAAGVDSTPSLYVNGRRYTLGLDADALGLAVDDELEWQAGANAWPQN